MFGSEKKEPEFKLDLGDEVKDTITGFTGIIIYRTQWIHNCNVYGVKSQELKDGKPRDTHQFDEPQLEVVVKDVVKQSRDTGGPTDSPQQSNRM